MDAVSVDVLVLNFNGSALLAECLPSIVCAAEHSRHRCRVVVVDNGSTDDSLTLLAAQFPNVSVQSFPNRGLCSYNDVLAQATCRVALLLNNDVKAEPDALDPLVDTLLAAPQDGDDPTLLVAPRCYLFDGRTHEGLQTAAAWRCGLIQATALFAGAERIAAKPGLTASAGAVIAIERERFLALGGFDSLYLPGRIEDLDFAFRGFAAGYQGRYEPRSVFYHRGAATFDSVLGRKSSDRLALRNTLLFQWKNLRRLDHRVRLAVGLTLRLIRDVVRAPLASPCDRYPTWQALVAARQRWQEHGRPTNQSDALRERAFFARHAPRSLLQSSSNVGPTPEQRATWHANEVRRDADFPLSQHTWRPWARALAVRLASRQIRPLQVTAAGAFAAFGAMLCLLLWPSAGAVAAAFVAVAWLCDRTDGPLARLTQTSSPLGAWIDANVDESVDIGLHLATAAAAARLSASPWPWICLVGFLVGKYLLMHGLASDDDVVAASSPSQNDGRALDRQSLLRRLYHLPGNADVRLHLLLLALVFGWLTLELALIAIYYNLRWIARYGLLARRMARRPATGGVA